MKNYIIRKIAFAVLSIFTVTTLTFILMKAIPGDPFQQEQALPQEIYQALRSHYGLNDPPFTQYLNYLKQLSTFNFGPSLIYKEQNVNQIIRHSFPTSALLGSTALAIALPSGLFIGILAAIRQNQWQDNCVSTAGIIGVSVPSFVIATLLQYLLAIKLELFPIARWESLWHLILPAFSLAALPTAFISRLVRVKMIEEMNKGYIKTARAKGLNETKIICFHVLRNILIPILSYLGPLTASILTGSFIVEKIYGIPGLGYWFVTSVSNRDYPLIMGVTVFYCTFLLFTTLIVDIISLTLDPRIASKKT